MLKALVIVIVILFASTIAEARGGGGHGGSHVSSHSSSVGKGSIYKGSQTSTIGSRVRLPLVSGHSSTDQAEASVEPDNQDLPWWAILLICLFGLPVGALALIGGAFGGGGSSGSWGDD